MKFFWTVCAAALALRLLFSVITPLDNDPAFIPYFNDEKAHLKYVEYITENNRLPVQTTSVQDGFNRAEFEYYQPPLFYSLARPFYTLGQRLIPGSEHIVVRFISILFSMTGLIVLYLAVRRFFRESVLADAVLILAAFGGITLRFGSVVTNDSFLFTVACLYAALILNVLHEKPDGRMISMGILVVVAGLWTKASFLLLLPLLPIALLLRRNGSPWQAVSSFALPLLTILPWYLRNYTLYKKFLPVEVGFGAADPLSTQNVFTRVYNTANYFIRSFVFPYDQSWGGLLDMFIYPLEGLVLIILFVFGLKALFRSDRTSAWIFSSAILLNLIGFISLNLRYFQSEARLLMPALPFILILLAIGAYHVTGKNKNRAMILLGLWIALPWVGSLV